MISVILFKMDKRSDFHLSFFQIVDAWQDFKFVTKRIKNFKNFGSKRPIILDKTEWIFILDPRSFETVSRIANLVEQYWDH